MGEASVFGVDCSGAGASPGPSPASNCTAEVAALKSQLATLQASAGGVSALERDEDANIDEADLEANACEEMMTLRAKVAELKQADVERNAPRPFPTKKHNKHH